ncbi:MAG: hypothetical protein HY078_03375 [Elusimicrobia bacterium]|nr:hypothetical protein [Elusimicrobiota bacterium]
MAESSRADRIKACLASSDLEGAGVAAKEAFADPASQEDELAWIAGVVYEAGVASAYAVLPAFVERFPESIHIIRAYFANLLERMGEMDAATEEARLYVRLVSKTRAWGELAQTDMIEKGVAGSIAVMTTAYRKVGARTYCLRLLAWGGRQTFGGEQKEILVQEAAAVREELKNPANAALDTQWEAFFSKAGHLSPELFDACRNACPALAKRIELIEGNFQFNSAYSLGDDEYLQLVYQTGDGAFVLA